MNKIRVFTHVSHLLKKESIKIDMFLLGKIFNSTKSKLEFSFSNIIRIICNNITIRVKFF